MQKNRTRSWMACGLFVIAGIIAGCSSAAEDPTPADSVHQSQEAVSACAITAGMSSTQMASLINGVRVTADPANPNARNLAAPNWCVCCDTLLSLANRDCQSQRQNWRAINAACTGVCGLCGCDSAYSKINYECG